MNDIIDRQLGELRKLYPAGVETLLLPSGVVLVTMGNISLPSGWNQQSTFIRFLLPVGYPFAAPDCFWTDEALRLESGAQPQATRFQAIPETGFSGLWFSWHVGNWNPNRSNLVTYAKVIEKRLREIR